MRLDRRLGGLVGGDHERAQGAGQAPGAGGRRSPGDQADDEPCGTNEHDDPDHRAEVEREAAPADRRQEAAEEVQVGVGRLGDEVEDRAQPRAVGHPRHVGDQDVGEDEDDVDDEERADVVGDVAAAERQRGSSAASSPATPRTAASKASRAPSRSSASSPASVLPPGEATALRTSAGWRAAQQLGGPGRRLHHQLPGQLGVEAVVGAGVGDRLDRQRQVGRRAAHHRGRRVEVLVGDLDHVPEQVQLRPHLGRRPSPATQSTPLRTSTADVRHHPQHFGPGEGRRSRATGTAARIETTPPRRAQLAAPPRPAWPA